MPSFSSSFYSSASSSTQTNLSLNHLNQQRTQTMNGVSASEQEDLTEEEEFVEVDPTGRYGRYNEILGKGASKTVYRGFDEYEGIEVAWNQVKVHDFLQKPEDLERLYCEIHLLKNLKHNNIMKFYTSWVDADNRNINFVTEMFTSGTLRQYRLKHKRVNIRAVKHWCRQILKGLHYLHSLNPPVIHRDLKCDNIFVNGNQGQVKIGDLGLAAVMRKSHAEHCVGTPEFMAPEVYEEEYNELVDIYAFGMCILEMVTFEYPYSECTHAAQIYKKVISGKKPDSLYKVEDPEVRAFVEKCLATVSRRLTAGELLDDPFLRIDNHGYSLRSSESDEMSPFLVHPNDMSFEDNHEETKIELFSSRDEDDDEQFGDVDIMIQGRRREDNDIFLRLRIADKEGRIRNIYFPFDIENDTALSVATEMVNELDITDEDVMRIANMIDDEISSLVPDWRSGFGSNNNNPDRANGPSLLDHVASENLGVKPGSAAVHGRFEEITYQEPNVIQFTDIWAQRDEPELGLKSGPREEVLENKKARCHSRSISLGGGGHGNLIRQELRWLKAKYQLQMRELRDQEAKLDREQSILPVVGPNGDESRASLGSTYLKEGLKRPALKCSSSFKCFGSDLEAKNGSNKGFYSWEFLPQPLHRATSLPVDAIDF